MEHLYAFFLELDKLKQVERRSYVSGASRHENSAEHSWHLALAVMTLQSELSLDIDLGKTLKLALVHDIAEIGAGDISVFDPARDAIVEQENAYIQSLSRHPLSIVSEIQNLWDEYEAQQTPESRWVKVLDRLLPFMLNMHTEGRAWRDQGVSRSQVIAINHVMAEQAPEIYDWLLKKLDEAVANGWLIED